MVCAPFYMPVDARDFFSLRQPLVPFYISDFSKLLFNSGGLLVGKGLVVRHLTVDILERGEDLNLESPGEVDSLYL
ncbi:hypothetical protein IEQ34_022863 [Dendrobium chrysotoxum]|uniref:Uncharacterized protein n=1 Tax=Dendrobium chrysotoxum TaxID=161865 RepID=A0AAV7G093_DENCH|nr:hypothetical protein IEQ34_022863 [Dendrobium chrysotoxum]